MILDRLFIVGNKFDLFEEKKELLKVTSDFKLDSFSIEIKLFEIQLTGVKKQFKCLFFEILFYVMDCKLSNKLICKISDQYY